MGTGDPALADYIHPLTGKTGLVQKLCPSLYSEDIKTQGKHGKFGNVYERVKGINGHLENTTR